MRIQSIVERHDLTARNHGQIMRQTNRKLGERHKTQRVRRHFTRNARSAVGGPYRFIARTSATMNRKRKMGVDPFRPNYQTGRLMSEVVGSGRVTATQHGWTWRARHSAFPLSRQRRMEIEAISKDEIAADTKLMGQEYERLAKLPQYQRRRRRRIS